jgi:hypothetical protein
MDMKKMMTLMIVLIMAAGASVRAQDPGGAAETGSPALTEAEKKTDENDKTAVNTGEEKSQALAETKKPAARPLLSLWGDVRLRYEIQDNFTSQYYGNRSAVNNFRDPADTFLLGRALAGFTLSPTDWLNLSLGGRYAGVWNSPLVSDSDFYNPEFGQIDSANRDDTEPYDCFLEIGDPFAKLIWLKVGRQRLICGDQRVFSDGDWSNTTKWLWDAAKLSLRYGHQFMDFHYGKTVAHNPDRLSLRQGDEGYGYESMGFYGHLQAGLLFRELGMEPFAFTKNNDEARTTFDGITYHYYDSERAPKIIYGDLESYYYGLRVYGRDLHGFDMDATFVYESGKWSTDSIDAYALHGLLAYSFTSVSFRPRLSVEYSYASGDSNSTDGIHGTYDGAFGDPYCQSTMGLTAWRNIIDYQANLSVQPIDPFMVKLSYHRLRLATAQDHWYLADARTMWYQSSNSINTRGDWGTDLGHLVEASVRIQMAEGSTFQTGYGHLVSGNFVKSLPNTNDKKKYATFFYFQWESRFDWAPFQSKAPEAKK